jgi:Family of unknown function (DUF6152)
LVFPHHRTSQLYARIPRSRRASMKFRTAALAALVALLAGSAWAHHNMSALFDFNDRVTLNGKLTKMDWRNPHIYVSVDAKMGDQVEEWSVEGPPPNFFRTRDINKTDIEQAIGKMVTAEVSRARNGSKSGLLRTLTLPDGKVVSACPQNC